MRSMQSGMMAWSLVVVLGALLLMGPRAGKALASNRAASGKLPTDETPTVLLVEPPAPARREISAKLTSILGLLPRPSAPYRKTDDGESRAVSKRAGKLEGRWAPIEAWAERAYQAGDEDAPDGPTTLEIRVAVNGVRGLSPGLASEGGAIRAFAVAGTEMPVFEQSMIGADGSRVRIPLTDQERTRALTVVRIYVVPSELADRIHRAGEGASSFPAIDPVHIAADRPEAVRSIIVEIYGARDDAEALARAVPVTKLAKLLSPGH